MKQKKEQEKYITTHQAAKILYVTPTTVIQWVNAGYIKCLKTIGKHRRISMSEINKIQKLMEENG